MTPTHIAPRIRSLWSPACRLLALLLLLIFLAPPGASQAQWTDEAWTETQKLVAGKGWQSDLFGWSSALWHDTALIGARFGLGEEGYAALYRLDGRTWKRMQYLRPDDLDSGANFGHAVALDENWALIGSRWRDDLRDRSGYGYLYRYDGSRWREEARLRPAVPTPNDNYGFAVALHGDVAAVTAYGDDTAAPDAGAVYLFRRTTDERGRETWTEEAKIVSPDREARGDWFGHAVALHGDVLVVGAILDDPITGASGSAYVYRYDGKRWQGEAKLVPSQGTQGALFGYSVDVWDDLIVVGAESEYYGEGAAGAAYVFRYDGTGWAEVARLAPEPSEDIGGDFGHSVSLWSNESSRWAAIGFAGDSTQALYDGSVVLYRSDDGGRWIREAKLTVDDGQENDYLGGSVALWDDHILAGAPYDDNENGSSAGSAYVFRREAEPGLTLTAETTGGELVPPEGGTVRYRARLANRTDAPRTLDAWSVIAGPEGTYRRQLGSVTLKPGARTYQLRQRIPSWAAAGTYEQAFYVGTYPDGIEASARVGFEKAEGAQGESDAQAGAEPWPAAVLEAVEAAEAETPVVALELEAYPNPLSGRSTLRYGLPEATVVRLVVYDVLGREVAVLVDGAQAAGTHEARLEASVLPAGVYFARLEAEGRTATRTLVKR